MGCTFMYHFVQSVRCRNENSLVCGDCNTSRPTDLTQGCHFPCIKRSEKNINNEGGGWESEVPLSCTHRSMLLPQSQTSSDWLFSSKHIPVGRLNLAALPFPSAKPRCDPASVETPPVVVISIKKSMINKSSHTHLVE